MSGIQPSAKQVEARRKAESRSVGSSASGGRGGHRPTKQSAAQYLQGVMEGTEREDSPDPEEVLIEEEVEGVEVDAGDKVFDSHVIGGYKAARANPRVSQEAKDNADAIVRTAEDAS